MASNKQISELVNKIADFWKRDTPIVYKKVAKQLIEKGFTLDESIEIIESIHFACAAEYGD